VAAFEEAIAMMKSEGPVPARLTAHLSSRLRGPLGGSSSQWIACASSDVLAELTARSGVAAVTKRMKLKLMADYGCSPLWVYEDVSDD
jgi:hypothetical protein